MMKKLAALLLSAFLIVCALVPAVSASAADQSTVIKAIQALGVINGDQSGNMNLTGNTTRAEFAKMMIAASTYKDTISKMSSVSPFKDVKNTYWAASYIAAAVDAGWLTGYVDGTYRPNNNITLEEAATAVLKMLGYTNSDFSGSFPEAQLAKLHGLGLDHNITKTRGQKLSRQDCMYLFYNLMSVNTKSGGTYAKTLGYSLNAAGELDYSSLVTANLKGPYIVTDSAALASSLPFSASKASVYRNGVLSSLSAVTKYDVFYYNANMRTVWVYRNMVTGIYTAASPSTAAPTSVTVAGKTYSITTSDAAYALSEMGAYKIGDTITILLGMNGNVVGVVPADEINETRYGLVSNIGTETLTDSLGNSYEASVITVSCTDGSAYKYTCENPYLDVGDVVQVNFTGGETTVSRLQKDTISGKVNTNATALGTLKFADDVEILDTTDNGSCAMVYPSRLAGVTLKASDVYYYGLNESGEVRYLILNDVTGDLNSYGIVTSVTNKNTSSMNVSCSYKYIINGTSGSFTSSGTVYDINTGPSSFEIKNNAIVSISNLSGVSLTGLNSVYAQGGNQQYPLAENVSVYLYKDSTNEYYLTNVSAISDTGKYTLKGYYDKDSSLGGRIRVIIAEEK